MSSEFVIGIDGGGTFTRVLLADRTGCVVSSGQGGAAYIRKDPHAPENVRKAIVQVIRDSGIQAAQVVALCAGIAGFDTPDDLEWVQTLTQVEGLGCRPMHVNDAVIAHRGAFVMEPGIIVVAGTGSIILAITETGRQVRNYDFGHYAYSAARHLGSAAVFEILARLPQGDDADLLQGVLDHFDVSDIADLRESGTGGFGPDRFSRNRLFAELAPLVTASATGGILLAQTICDRAIHEIVVGVKLLGPLLARRPVGVALIGGVATSDYFRRMLSRQLQADGEYQIVVPRVSPAAGAVLMALADLGVVADARVLENLAGHPAAAQ